MRRSDVAPPGHEKQVRALKEKPGIDNPYAVAWASKNASDDNPDTAAPMHGTHFDEPAVAGTEPRMTGHSGATYTYGQRRGETPAQSPHNEREQKGGPFTTMADDNDVAAFHKAVGDDDDFLDDDGDFDSRRAGDEGDDNAYDDLFDDDEGEPVHAQIEAAAHRGTGGHVTGDHVTGEDGNAHAEPDGDDDEDEDEINYPTEEAATSDPPIAPHRAHGTSAGPVVDVPRMGGAK